MLNTLADRNAKEHTALQHRLAQIEAVDALMGGDVKTMLKPLLVKLLAVLREHEHHFPLNLTLLCTSRLWVFKLQKALAGSASERDKEYEQLFDGLVIWAESDPQKEISVLDINRPSFWKPVRKLLDEEQNLIGLDGVDIDEDSLDLQAAETATKPEVRELWEAWPCMWLLVVVAALLRWSFFSQMT